MVALRKSEIDGTVVRDFAERILRNLEFIEREYERYRRGETDVEVFEVTQLINSMLGLLVFPKESFWNNLKPLPINEIPKKYRPFKPSPNAPDLRELIRLMRNSFAHYNIQIKEKSEYIYAIEMYNINKKGVETWRDAVRVFELRDFIKWFIKGVINSTLLELVIEKIA